MTTAFNEMGDGIAVTLLQPLPVWVVQIKTPEKDGYHAVKLAYGETTWKHVTKPVQGELKKAGIEVPLRYFYEYRPPGGEEIQVEMGQKIEPQKLCRGWLEVNVTGKSKGRGFAGAMKRWGFHGQSRTHGTKSFHRAPASNNATDPARVFKGSKRPGRYGGKTVTILRLGVFEYQPELNLLVVDGSVPGPRGGRLFVEVVDWEEVAEEQAAPEPEAAQAVAAGSEEA